MASIESVDSRRASQIFRFDEANLGSPVAAKIWRTQSEPFASFTSVAATHWEMVLIRQHGRTSLFVRGPETKSSLAAMPADAEFLHEAVSLLEGGAAILDVVARNGFADQAHLTRSLRRFIGHTPAQILRNAVNPPASAPG